jgi:hypothetical protein
VAQKAPEGVWLCESALLAVEPAPCEIVCKEAATLLELRRDDFVEALLLLSTDAAVVQVHHHASSDGAITATTTADDASDNLAIIQSSQAIRTSAQVPPPRAPLLDR